ncbi:MAG: YciI family protein, partial [Bacteroidota bacterium]
MIKNLFAAVLCLLTFGAHAQYDAALAKKTGADDYGMRKYVMANLKTGPTKITDKAQAAEIQKAHLKNIQKLADEGKLVVAGPYMDKGDVRGIFIFAVETVEEAKALTETDPAIKAGVLTMELRPFYCSAALLEVNNLHKKLEKKNV